MIGFEHRLKLVRMNRKLTQSQLAERVGVNKSMISSYETAARLPSLTVLVKLSYELKVTTDYLLGIEKDECFNIPTLSEKQKKAMFAILDAFKNDE